MTQEEKETRQKIVLKIFKNMPVEKFKISVIESIQNAKTKESLGNILLNTFEISQMENVIKY